MSAKDSGKLGARASAANGASQSTAENFCGRSEGDFESTAWIVSRYNGSVNVGYQNIPQPFPSPPPYTLTLTMSVVRVLSFIGSVNKGLTAPRWSFHTPHKQAIFPCFYRFLYPLRKSGGIGPSSPPLFLYFNISKLGYNLPEVAMEVSVLSFGRLSGLRANFYTFFCGVCAEPLWLYR